MKHKEISQLSKSAWRFIEQAKTNAAQNIVLAASKNEIRIEKSELPKLLALVNASIDQGYHQISKSFEDDVKKSFDVVASEKK